MDIDDDSPPGRLLLRGHPRQGRPRGPEGRRPHLPVRLPRGRPGLCEAVGPKTQRGLHPHRRLRREEAHLPGGGGAAGAGPVRLCPRPPHGGQGALRLFRQRPPASSWGPPTSSPPGDAPAWAVETVAALAKAMGFGRVVYTTPEEHDQVIAYTSQVPHALACAYVMSPPVQAAQGLFRRQLPGRVPGGQHQPRAVEPPLSRQPGGPFRGAGRAPTQPAKAAGRRGPGGRGGPSRTCCAGRPKSNGARGNPPERKGNSYEDRCAHSPALQRHHPAGGFRPGGGHPGPGEKARLQGHAHQRDQRGPPSTGTGRRPAWSRPATG